MNISLLNPKIFNIMILEIQLINLLVTILSVTSPSLAIPCCLYSVGKVSINSFHHFLSMTIAFSAVFFHRALQSSHVYSGRPLLLFPYTFASQTSLGFRSFIRVKCPKHYNCISSNFSVTKPLVHVFPDIAFVPHS